MFKNVKVNYPKKSQLLRSPLKITHLKEPVRDSLYTHVVNNLKIAGRVTYIHRIIYMGRHNFTYPEQISELLEQIVIKSNESFFCFEKLTGFLLYYDKHFIHVVEGDEDTINYHLHLLIQDKLYEKHIVNAKFLLHLSHINQRIIDEWKSYYGIPPKLVKTANEQFDTDTIRQMIITNVQKIHDFITQYQESNFESEQPSKTELQVNVSKDGTSLLRMSSTKASIDVTSSYRIFTPSNLLGFQKKMYMFRSSIPEVEFIDFVIKKNLGLDLEKYNNLYLYVPERNIYKDRVWPPPMDFEPYIIFEDIYNRIVELPKPVNRSMTTFDTKSQQKLDEEDDLNEDEVFMQN